MTAQHTWKVRPDEKTVKAHINLFISTLSQGDLVKAFTLCPAKTWDEPEFADPNDHEFFKDFLGHAVFQAIDGQEAVEDFSGQYKEENPKSWCKFITPPEEVKYKGFNLEITKGGEVTANLHLNGQVTGITVRYDLVEQDGQWLLAFSSFEVM